MNGQLFTRHFLIHGVTETLVWEKLPDMAAGETADIRADQPACRFSQRIKPPSTGNFSYNSSAASQ